MTAALADPGKPRRNVCPTAGTVGTWYFRSLMPGISGLRRNPVRLKPSPSSPAFVPSVRLAGFHSGLRRTCPVAGFCKCPGWPCFPQGIGSRLMLRWPRHSFAYLRVQDVVACQGLGLPGCSARGFISDGAWQEESYATGGGCRFHCRLRRPDGPASPFQGLMVPVPGILRWWFLR